MIYIIFILIKHFDLLSPVGQRIVVLEETIRTEIYHYMIKVITQNNPVLIGSDRFL